MFLLLTTADTEILAAQRAAAALPACSSTPVSAVASGMAPSSLSRLAAASKNAASPHDGSNTRSAGVRIAQAATYEHNSAGVKNAPLALRSTSDPVGKELAVIKAAYALRALRVQPQ